MLTTNEVGNRSSMLYWWPRIKDLPIPQPKTIVVPVDVRVLSKFWDQGVDEPLKPFIPQLKAAGSEIGYPLFLRTDILSAKHEWEDSCYLEHERDLLRNIWALLDVNFGISGPSPSALVFRQYVPLASKFTAFSGKMPIAPERRYFVRKGVVQCHHPYWPLDSVWGASVSDWVERLTEMNLEPVTQIALLGYYAKKVGRVLKGYWSVDFAPAADGRWLLIDCAEGGKSHHWKDCQYAEQTSLGGYWTIK